MTTITVLDHRVLLNGREVPEPDSITYNATTGYTTLGYRGEPVYALCALPAQTLTAPAPLRQSGLEAEYGQPVGEYPTGIAARALAALDDVFSELDALRAANKQLQAELAAREALPKWLQCNHRGVTLEP